MSQHTKITDIRTQHNRRIVVDGQLITVSNTETGRTIYTIVDEAERRVLAKALDPDRGDEYVDWKAMYEQAIQERDALDSRLTRVDMECAEALDRAAEFERERDRWKEATKRALEHRDEANARADAAEAKVRELEQDRDGRIVYTVEERDVEAEGRKVEVVDTGRQFNIRIQGQAVNAIKSSTEAREKAQRHIEAAARCEAIARRIETDTTVDPIEDAAVAAFKAAWHRADEEGDEGNRVRRGIRAARHVLGQEADQ